ncbi:AAA family ATPase, partial [Tyzzerella nexilis]|nr:AAA family ATPase [[Clostridium] nexile]
AITDATSLTEAGYIGDEIESVVSKLLAAEDNDVEKAERGIIFIDEIYKIAKKKNTNQRAVSGKPVQQGMSKL